MIVQGHREVLKSIKREGHRNSMIAAGTCDRLEVADSHHVMTRARSVSRQLPASSKETSVAQVHI